MIHHVRSIVDCADALHDIERDIDFLKLSVIASENYDDRFFSQSRDELISGLIYRVIEQLEIHISIALESLDVEGIVELQSKYRAMLESNSLSVDENLSK